MQTLASLTLVPGSDTVAKAMAWLESTAEHERWPQGMTFKLNLCLDEALANIVMHGFKNSPDGADAASIRLAILAKGRRIVIDILDNGMPFDPTERTPDALADSLEHASIGGHGLRLMRHYLENIEYQRINQRNHLRLTVAFADDKAEP